MLHEHIHLIKNSFVYDFQGFLSFLCPWVFNLFFVFWLFFLSNHDFLFGLWSNQRFQVNLVGWGQNNLGQKV